MPFPQLPGETTGVGGVVNTDFPPGNIRRYANGAFVHDAVNIIGTFTPGSAVVTGVSPADIALVAVGQSLADVTDIGPNFGTPAILPTVVSKAASSFTMSAASTATTTKTNAIIAIGTEWANVPQLFQAMKANAKHPAIEIDFGVGDIFGGWNLGGDWSGARNAPAKINFNRVNFWGVAHFLEGVSYLDCRGSLGSYDRVGLAGGYRVTATVVAGSRQIVATDPVNTGDFTTTPVGAMIQSASIRTAAGEVVAKISNTVLQLTEPALVNGNVSVYVNSNQLNFDTLIGLHDVRRNPYSPGRGNRGAHLVGPFNLMCRRLWQQDCDQTIRTYTVRGVASPFSVPFAAVNIDFVDTRNCNIEHIWVQDSATHGVMMTGGFDVNIGQIQVDGSVRGGIQFPMDGDPGVPVGNGDVLPGAANSYAQACQGKGIWLNKVSGYIGQYTVRQKNDPPSGAEKARVMIEDTGDSAVLNEKYKPLVLGKGYVEIGSKTAGAGASVYFGDPDGTTGQMNVRHGPLVIEMHEGYGLATNEAMVNFYVTSAPAPLLSRIVANDISVINTQGFLPLLVRSGSTERKFLVIGLDTFDTDVAGGIADIVGHANGELRVTLRATGFNGAASYVAKAMISADLCDQLLITNTRLDSQFICSNAPLRITNSQKVVVQNSSFNNMRGNGVGNGGAVQLANNADVTFDGVTITNPGGNIAGIFGILLDAGTHAKMAFRRVDVTDYEVGIKKHASATLSDQIVFESCHAWVTSGSITPTDIPAANRVRIA